MSKIRYEQTQDTSHIKHVHDGLNGVRLKYDVDLHSHPRTLNNAREANIRITGKQGTIDYLEHGCGMDPVVRCYVGGKETKIRIEIDNTMGLVRWYSNKEFTIGDDARLVIFGMITEYTIDDNDGPNIPIDRYWCGYEWNVNDSNPAVTRITGEGMEDYFLRDGGGILKGTLFEYVAVDSTTGEEVEVPIDDAEAYENYRYGQHGDLFAKMRGQLYYKVEKEGDIRRKKLSRYPLPGFRPYHSNDYIVYIGLYEASCNNERTKIYSRVTPESEYVTHVGGNKDSNYTEKLYNMPTTNINTASFSDIAHNKGEGYDIMDYMTWLMLSDLFMAEFGTRNSQASIQSNDNNGYSQGGLGLGCAIVSNWVAYNGYNPPAQMGCTDTHGSGCGQSLVPACINLGLEPTNNVYANRFYGIENPFGHIFKLLTGIHFITKVNTTNNFEYYKTFICDDPSKFMVAGNRDNGNDDNNIQFEAGYNYEGEKCHTNGFIKDVIFADYGSMIPSAVGGGSSTYFADYNYSEFGDGRDFSGLHFAPFGNISHNGSHVGWFCVNSCYGWSRSYQDSGTRLCLYKQPYEEMPFFVEDCSGEDNEVVIVKKASANEIVDAPLAPDVYLEYSYDTVNWKTLPITSADGYTIYLPPNGRVYLRGDNYTLCNRYNNVDMNVWLHRYTHISCNNNFNLGGNIMSLLYKDFIGKIDLTNNGEYTFSHLFSNNQKLISSNKLVLPATILQTGCYGMLFRDCFNQVYTTKQLPSTNIYANCYAYMYTNNMNLLYTPKECFTEVVNYSIFGMYEFNRKITEHKTLINIRTLKPYSLNYIFNNCSNLKLVYAPRVDYDNTNGTFKYWLNSVHPTGTIYIPYDVDWRTAPRDGNGIPAGWEIKYIDPDTMEERESLYPIE